jgi:hypothetical protein
VTDNQTATGPKTGSTIFRAGTAGTVGTDRPSRVPLFRSVFLAVSLIVLSACTQGVTGIFADIEQEVEIKTNNLVDNTFVARVVQANTDGTERYFAVAGTKLFARGVDGSSWSGSGSPSGRSLAQFVAAIDDNNDGNANELYAVFREAEKDNYGLYRLNENGNWELLYDPRDQEEPAVNRITGLTSIDTTGDATPDRLIATMAEENGKRYLVVDPQEDASREFHQFDGANGDDLDANRPAGKALVSINGVTKPILWVARNALWYIEVGDLGTAATPLKRVPTPINLASIEYVPGEDRLFLVTLDGGVFRSPETIAAATGGGTLDDWTATGAGGWESIASQSRAFSDLLWLSTGAADHEGLFLVSTLTYGNRTRRGYFYAQPTGAGGNEFSALGFSDPQGNYRSTELSSAGITRVTRLGNTVFALTENNGLWSTPSYLADQVDDPVWIWE